ncbi:hypothetical protein IQ07DRAFT_74864 [Pyrenochaeta sp. DS3sAY3a]|nr:hypothetical protein IQ07DRAFT_74864 [Pyrenochaeta sp. DS3sAY3a]
MPNQVIRTIQILPKTIAVCDRAFERIRCPRRTSNCQNLSRRRLRQHFEAWRAESAEVHHNRVTCHKHMFVAYRGLKDEPYWRTARAARFATTQNIVRTTKARHINTATSPDPFLCKEKTHLRLAMLYLRLCINSVQKHALPKLRRRTVRELPHHQSSDEIRPRKMSLTLYNSKYDVTYSTCEIWPLPVPHSREKALAKIAKHRQNRSLNRSLPIRPFPCFPSLTNHSPSRFLRPPRLLRPNIMLALSIPYYLIRSSVMIASSRLQTLLVNVYKKLVYMDSLNCIFIGS